MTIIQDILGSLADRTDLWGVATAAKYLGALVPCFNGDGVCPQKLFDLTDSSLWTKEMSEANERLVYAIKEMHDNDVMEKSLRDGTDITSGAVLEYDCVLSARTKDRDGDVLWQKGYLEVDPKMPLLWQHIRLQPIGKHVRVIGQTDDDTRSRFAIADTALGRDAATLVKFGALRKSHGFVPQDARPLGTKKLNGKDVVTGWEVRKSLCVEGSLVSVPSNDRGEVFRIYQKECDGICTAFSRDLLKSPAVTVWAKAMFDSRPAMVVGGIESVVTKEAVEAEHKADGHSCTCADHAKKTETKLTASVDEKFSAVMARLDAIEGKKQMDEVDGESGDDGGDQDVSLKSIPEPIVGESDDEYVNRCLAHKSALETDVVEKQSYPMPVSSPNSVGFDTMYVPGSWEWVQFRLRQAGELAIRMQESDYPRDSSVDLVATFSETCVLCLRSWSRDPVTGRDRNVSECYEFPWSLNDEGVPQITGEGSDVTVQLAVKEKSLREVDGVISAAMAGDRGAVMALRKASEAHEMFADQEYLVGFVN